MADNIWQGSTNNYDTGGNWSLGAKPADTNSVFCPRTNAQDILVGINDETGIDLELWMHERGCTIDLGDSSTYAHLSANLLRHEGSGTIYWDNDEDGTTDVVLCNSDNKTLAMDLKGSGSDDYGRITLLKGRMKLTTGAMISGGIIQVGFRDNPSDAYMEILSGFTAPALLQQNSGFLTCVKNVTTAEVAGGSYEQTGTSTLTTLYAMGGEVLWNTTGTLTTAHIMKGVIDMTRSAGTKTITTCYLWPGATLIRNPSIHVVTSLVNLGGREVQVS